jgi:hypothetical protein
MASVVRVAGGDPRGGRQGGWRCLPLHVERLSGGPMAGGAGLMFERAACPHPLQLTASPFVGVNALIALSELLRQASNTPRSSSNALHSGASISSRDQNRGEAHDHAKAGTPASNLERPAKASAKRPLRTNRAVRRRNTGADAGMAGSAGGDAGDADPGYGAVVPYDAVDPPQGRRPVIPLAKCPPHRRAIGAPLRGTIWRGRGKMPILKPAGG